MHFASMSLGIFDFLINWLTEFIIWVVGWIFELINTLLARTWFSIGTSFANILDMLQGTFKKLCGMETVNTKPASVSSFRNIKTTDVCC